MKDANQNQGLGKLPIFIGAGVLALVMVVTNPSKDKYLNHISSGGKQSAACQPKSNQSGQSDPLKQALEQASVDMCKQLQQGMGKMIGEFTTRQNFLLFSIYTTEFGGSKSSAIGILGNFISLG